MPIVPMAKGLEEIGALSIVLFFEITLVIHII